MTKLLLVLGWLWLIPRIIGVAILFLIVLFILGSVVFKTASKLFEGDDK